jgi:chromosome segregation ATPase
MSEYAEINDEVMTYAPVRNLGREVAELEAQRRQLQHDNAELKIQRDMLYAELAAYQEVQDKAQQKLDAVPEYAIEYGDWLLNNAHHAPPTFDEWYMSYQGVQHAGV